ncbi:hypothetical protein AAFF_G00038360 [Aldrovandia affinis]|uniref:Uncharacterized protein n=1 Tax=Aldrovandia affinis TaxID=143900 RepID=A0AAD7T548_9TELE|nr:hypothetical protein AAFF_G00038360 [Aldrovandia affinis]
MRERGGRAGGLESCDSRRIRAGHSCTRLNPPHLPPPPQRPQLMHSHGSCVRTRGAGGTVGRPPLLLPLLLAELRVTQLEQSLPKFDQPPSQSGTELAAV